MANRYWVGGTGNFNSTNTTNWSTTSGGSGGASIPAAGDVVIFDSNSSATSYSVSFDGTVTAQLGGATFGAPASGTLTFNGGASNFSMGTGTVTIAASGVTMSIFVLYCYGTVSLTTNNVPISYLYCDTTSSVTLGSAFTASTRIQVYGGTFNTANYTVTTGVFGASDIGWARTLTFGSSTINVTSSSAATFDVHDTSSMTPLTVTASTAVINMSGSGASKQFLGGGASWPTLNNGGSSSTITITGNNTFANITNTVQPCTFLFANGSTQTLSSLTTSGTAGNLVTLNSDSAGLAFTLSKAGGSVSISYMSIKDSTATGGATWTATSSTNGGNNTGWVFAGAALPSSFLGFFMR